MNEPESQSPSSLDVIRQIDSLCDRYEADRRAGRVTRLEDLLTQVPHPHRAELLEELLHIERELSRQSEDRSRGMGIRSGMRGASSPGSENEPSGGRFHALRHHAQGGLGRIWVAFDAELRREVAVKEILPDQAAHRESRDRFVLEAEVTGRLEHPGIVPVYGLGMASDGRPFYAMRFIQGVTFNQAVRKFHQADRVDRPYCPKRSFEFRQLLGRFIAVCNAIDFAHSRGIVHRDIKPDNIMLGEYGETLVVDWGMAKVLSKTEPSATYSEPRSPQIVSGADAGETIDLAGGRGSDEMRTQEHAIFGTPQFMCPEQAAGAASRVGPAGDVYSLGATLYCLLVGKPPVEGTDSTEVLNNVIAGRITPPRKADRSISRPLEAICLKALSREPADRYATARQLADDLEKWLADEPIAALPDDVSDRVTRWMRRNRHWMQAGTAAMLLVTVVSIAAYFYQRETAAENLRLADEKGHLAEEKSKLAEEKERLAHDEKIARQTAEAKNAALRETLAANYFARGVNEYAAGRVETGTLDVYRAWAITPNKHPLKRSYERVLVDRMTRGGRSSTVPMRHGNAVWSAVFGGDGDVVLTQGWNGNPQRWDSRTGEPIGSPLPHGTADKAIFSPQEDRILTAGSDGTARLWDARTSRTLGKVIRHRDAINRIAFNPAGTRILTGSRDETSRLWDARTGEPMSEPLPQGNWVLVAVFNRDGSQVVTADYDGSVKFWNAESGERIHELQHGGPVFTIVFSPKGDRMVTAGSNRGTARLWDTTSWQPLGEPMSHQGNVYSVKFSPDGKHLVTGGEGEDCAKLWDAFTGAPLGEPMMHDDFVRSVAFSPQGDRIASAAQDNVAKIWDAETCKPLAAPMPHEDHVNSVYFSPRGECVLTTSNDGTARIWDPISYEVPLLKMHHGGEIMTIAFSPQCDRVLVGGGNSATVFDATTGKPVGKPLQHAKQVMAVSFSPLGDKVATAGLDSTARIWDAQTGDPIGDMLRHDAEVYVVAFSPLGDRVITGGDDHRAKLWDAQTGRSLGEPLEHKEAVRAAAFSPDGRLVLTGSGDGTAKVWDARTGSALGKFMHHGGYIGSIAFSPNGERIATGGGHQARLWNAETYEVLGQPMHHTYPVWHVAFSPQGDRLLTANTDKTARLWDANTGQPIGEPMRHEHVVNSAAFSPDGERVATASYDGTARVWDAKTGAPLGVPLQHHTIVRQAFFSEDGNKILTCCHDGHARLWNSPPIPAPADLGTAIPLFTGYLADQDGRLSLLNKTEWYDLWQRFREQNMVWINERIEERSKLRRAMKSVPRPM